MDKIIESLNKISQKNYDYLKLFEVTYDKKSLECVVTFLYPQTMSDIADEDRKIISESIKKIININGKIRVKFKKSFLDEKLVKKEIINFISTSFKAISVYIEEKQVEIEQNEERILITFKLGKEIRDFFESSNAPAKICEHLNKKFISNFQIVSEIDENFAITEEIGEVEAPVLFRKNLRYKVFTVQELIGEGIASEPEFIKDNTSAKEGVILAGVISEIQKKTFTRKKGKRAGEEGTYYSFSLNDGKKIEGIYFCPKANIKKMDLLADGMTVLCLGDIKLGLGGDKLTYYLKKIAIANIDEESKIQKPQKTQIEHKNVVEIEDFVTHKQQDLFAKQAIYNDFIMNNTIVVFDLETTGIDTLSDKIIEIGAVKVQEGKVTKKFSTFVNPEMHIPDEASKVNNIFDNMVEDAPKIGDVMLDFLDFCKGCVVAGYNNINFDNRFISRICKELSLVFENETVDVFNMARQKPVKAKNFKLTTVVSALGLSLEGAHRAYNDAYATAEVMLKLNEVE